MPACLPVSLFVCLSLGSSRKPGQYSCSYIVHECQYMGEGCCSKTFQTATTSILFLHTPGVQDSFGWWVTALCFLLIFLFLYYFINIFLFLSKTIHSVVISVIQSILTIVYLIEPVESVTRSHLLTHGETTGWVTAVFFFNNFVTFTHLAVHCSTLMMSLKVATSSLPIPQKISLHRWD